MTSDRDTGGGDKGSDRGEETDTAAQEGKPPRQLEQPLLWAVPRPQNRAQSCGPSACTLVCGKAWMQSPAAYLPCVTSAREEQASG